MKATYQKYILTFKNPSGTSRGILKTKETWFLLIENEGKTGIGECGILRGLSIDDVPNYEEKLQWLCKHIHLDLETLLHELSAYPSIQFGIEQAFLDLESKKHILFPSAFTQSKKSISINGLIWMGTPAFMKQQIQLKIKEEFQCLKMKIGAINFSEELEVLRYLRSIFKNTIRVDANGAFMEQEARSKLQQLETFKIHSIEQPIAPKQWQEMALLCEESPIPIALDEELIGAFTLKEKEKLLQTIQPQYIILKPSLIGGFAGTKQWIQLAQKYNIGWWITSALESNIGLNAIAQFTYTLKNKLPQGLGTGSLFTNNFSCPLQVKNGTLWYSKNKTWNLNI